tara:strand:- start:932 stop:1594 length:663 start_codon:yes stop_codon:yes gene_type:complete
MILIEFLGLPGSGKTFYSKKLLSKISFYKKVKSENYLKIRFVKKVLLVINFYFENFIYVSLIFYFHFFNKNLDRIWKSRHLYYLKNEFLKYQFYKSKNIVLINSEGFHHRAIFYLLGKLIDNDKGHKIAKLLLSNIPKPDYLVLVQTDKKNSIKSTQKRKRGFKYDAKTLKEIQTNIKTITFIKKIVRKDKKINLIELNRKNSINKNLNILKKKVIQKIK